MKKQKGVMRAGGGKRVAREKGKIRWEKTVVKVLGRWMGNSTVSRRVEKALRR